MKHGESKFTKLTMIIWILDIRKNIKGLELKFFCAIKLTCYQSRPGSLVSVDASRLPGTVSRHEHGSLGRGFPHP